MARRGPFPGMDPWLEQYWGNFHASLTVYLRDWLNAHLPPGLVAVSEQRIVVEMETRADRSVYPDVHVLERAPASVQSVSVDTGVEIAEPIVVELPSDAYEQPYVQ